MKYLVVSDIHGVKAGAEAVVESARYHSPDAILCLGDVLYHGPRNGVPEGYDPIAVIDLLNPLYHKMIAVRGNCDAEVDQMVLDFPITADYNVLDMNGRRVIMSHGHVYSPDHTPKMEPGDVFISGHTHLLTAVEKDGCYYLNPGSVSLPKGGNPATYGVLDETGFTVYTLDHKEFTKVTF